MVQVHTVSALNSVRRTVAQFEWPTPISFKAIGQWTVECRWLDGQPNREIADELVAILNEQGYTASANDTSVTVYKFESPHVCEDCGQPCDTEYRVCWACGGERDFKHGLTADSLPY